MSFTSRASAQEVVAGIRRKNGGISAKAKEVLQEDFPELWDKTRVIQERLDKALQPQIETIRSTTEDRFIYELIRNADESRYHAALAIGKLPSLTFNIHPNQITIDSNCDGLTIADVELLCSVNSPCLVDRPIVEPRMLGLRSVFKVAKKACIQSCHVSFSFTHDITSEKDAFRMTTPVDEPFADLPEGIQTRIVLELREEYCTHKMFDHFRNLDEGLLVFLETLREIKIDIHTLSEPGDNTVFNIEDDCPGIRTIKKTIKAEGSDWSSNSSVFYWYRKQFNESLGVDLRYLPLPTTVALAFPLDESRQPRIGRQHVYSHYPMCASELKFAIQANFFMGAEDNTIASCWENKALSKAIAWTFRGAIITAIRELRHECLWTRYLPTESLSHEYWREFKVDLRNRLTKYRLLNCVGTYERQVPKELRWVPPSLRDQQGKPLFCGLQGKGLLKESTVWNDEKVRYAVGLDCAQWYHFFDAVDADAKHPDHSTMKSFTDEDWHARVATVLANKILDWFLGGSGFPPMLNQSPLIPLEDGSWISRETCLMTEVYFKHSVSFDVPTDRNIRFVDPVAASVPARRLLFCLLGVKNMDMEKTMEFIGRKSLAQHQHQRTETLDESVAYFKFFFWSLPREHVLTGIGIYDEEHKLVDRNQVWVEDPPLTEFRDKCPLRIRPNTESSKLHDTHFLHPQYLNAVAETVVIRGRTWKTWLQEACSIKFIPPPLEFVIEKQPDKFLTLLQKNWGYYHYYCKLNHMWDVIGKTRVATLDDTMHPLEACYLPLPSLTAIFPSKLGLTPPFVKLPQLEDGCEADWSLLKHFGVQSEDGMEFYTSVLNRLGSTQYSSDCDALECAVKAYSGIMRVCIRSGLREAQIRSLFTKNSWIYSPESDKRMSQWLFPADCVWEAPPWPTDQVPLGQAKEYHGLRHLFCDIVGIPIQHSHWLRAISELESLKRLRTSQTSESSEGAAVIKKIFDVYEYLSKAMEFWPESRGPYLRSRMESLALLFVPSTNSWHPISSCIWTTNNQLVPEGKMAVGAPYASLEAFFTGVLNIQKPDISTLVKHLQTLAEQRASLTDIKGCMMDISSMLPLVQDVEALRNEPILPVRALGGITKMGTPMDEFFVIDRQEYSELFGYQLTTLDFSMWEIRACENLLLALGLGPRFLSGIVRTETIAQGISEQEQLTKMLRSRAEATVRCVAHFRDAACERDIPFLSRQISNITVYATDDIFIRIQLLRGDIPWKTGRDTTYCHLEIVDGSLRIFVPLDKRKRELCLVRRLPKALLDFYGVQDAYAEVVLSQVWNGNSLEVVEDVLEDAGIRKIELDASLPGSSEPNEVQNKRDGKIEKDVKKVDQQASKNHDAVEELHSRFDSVLSLSEDGPRKGKKAGPQLAETRTAPLDAGAASMPERDTDEKTFQFSFRCPTGALNQQDNTKQNHA
ncbi:chaperone protein [Diplodia corticola]|uniref:Chaperone protein n=1 Tax=Diplodia corticola TaxID=236234 RepID=A0A1J9RV18_9PEZI|nr:chaperone protein [Diplodia corticola]OJD31684.1 chaperone protein [Diplodia corticola]